MDPENKTARGTLGNVHARKALWLIDKGDWDEAIVEFREALRLDPNDGWAHYGLGPALERKVDTREALEEYRTAYSLEPGNPQFKQAYEGLLQRVNQ